MWMPIEIFDGGRRWKPQMILSRLLSPAHGPAPRSVPAGHDSARRLRASARALGPLGARATGIGSAQVAGFPPATFRRGAAPRHPDDRKA